MAWKEMVFTCLISMFSASSIAGEAHICYSPTVSLMPATQVDDITDKTKIGCQGMAPMTIPELAANGWKIVQVTPN